MTKFKKQKNNKIQITKLNKFSEKRLASGVFLKQKTGRNSGLDNI
jgi:hypothetical protein